MTRGTPTDGAIAIPEAAASLPPTPLDEVDRRLAEVAARKDDWAGYGLDARITLLEQVMRDSAATAEEWDAAANAVKAIDPSSPAGAEDIATGPMQIVRHARLLKETLESLRDHGEVRLPKPPTTRPDGQVVVPVFPTSLLDRLLFVGHSGEVWMQPHVTLASLRTGRIYREPPPGRVCFILGAGNFGAGAVSDALHKLFAEGQVCIIKMNPVNEYIGPYVERCLTALVREGLVRVVYGGVEVGQHLTDHPSVDAIHMTASDKTHDAVVFGSGDEGRERKAHREPRTTKPVTSELGAVNPVLVVPGPWSQADIDYQGKHLASMLAMNAGFTCLCPRVIVQHRRWRGRAHLVDAIRRSLAESPPRHAYYPGARDRWEVFVGAHPEAETFGPVGDGAVPWTFIPDLDPDAEDEVAFRVEAFNGVFTETSLDAPEDVAAYLEQAVAFCNERLWGTLSATILVHPRTLKDPAAAAALDRAVADLRYGTIGINVWAGTGYGLGSTTWGAYPGHPPHDIQSGSGVIHNTYLLEDPQKSVIRAPFRLGRKPPMSYDFATFPSLIRKLLHVEATGDWKALPGIVRDGMRA